MTTTPEEIVARVKAAIAEPMSPSRGPPRAVCDPDDLTSLLSILSEQTEEVEGLKGQLQGSSRDHAPVAGSALETAWVVLGSSGQWSDWSQWVVCVCPTEQDAKDRVGELTSAMRQHRARKPEPADDEDFDTFYDRSEAEREVWQEGFSAIDPQADDQDEPRYRPQEAPISPSSAKLILWDSPRDDLNPLETALSESREREKVLEAGLLTISTAPCYGDASDSQTLSAVINFAGDVLTPKPLGGEA